MSSFFKYTDLYKAHHAHWGCQTEQSITAGFKYELTGKICDEPGTAYLERVR